MTKSVHTKLEPDRFRVDIPATPFPAEKKQTYPKQTEPFLRGPVPLWWLITAGRERGKALAVGVALWYQSGLSRQNPVKPTRRLWGKFGISRRSASIAIRALEAAGLVSVVRKPGCAPVVTIVKKQLGISADVAA